MPVILTWTLTICGGPPQTFPQPKFWLDCPCGSQDYKTHLRKNHQGSLKTKAYYSQIQEGEGHSVPKGPHNEVTGRKRGSPELKLCQGWGT